MGHNESHHEKSAVTEEPLAPLRIVADVTDKGHEIDLTPDRPLFGLIGGFVVVLLIAGFGVWQLFSGTMDGLATKAANSGSPILAAYNQKEAAILLTYGTATPEEGVQTIRVPVAAAARIIIADPTRFAPGAPPVGWTHPDDIAR